jgi:hypothetical protein
MQAVSSHPDRFVRREDLHVPIRWETGGELKNRAGDDGEQESPPPFTNRISIVHPAATDKAACTYFCEITEKKITFLSNTFREKKNQLYIFIRRCAESSKSLRH